MRPGRLWTQTGGTTTWTWEFERKLRSQGYFKASVHSRPYLILAKADELEYIVRVEAEPGQQYRLRELQFKSADPDSGQALAVKPNTLHNLIPLRPGDIFDVSKVREGLEAIEKLYGQLGYIDETSEPGTNVDEQNHQIDLVVNIDEQLQYRVADFEVLGLDSQTARSLESLIEPGQVFNKTSFNALLKEWFKEHESVLPANSSIERYERYVEIARNQKDATIRILLDLRPCPKT